MAYRRQQFINHVTDEKGNVVVQGTILNKEIMEHIEDGIVNLTTKGVPQLMTVHFSSGSKMAIRCKDWTENKDFLWRFDGVGSKNKTANLLDCGVVDKNVLDSQVSFSMSKTAYKDCSDDTAPVQFNGCYFSGNHASTAGVSFTIAGHSMTVADIGSTWTDSDTANPELYMLYKVESTKLYFITLRTETTSGNGPYNYLPKHEPIAPLKHVKNGTHTGDINFTNFGTSVETSPGVNHVCNKYYVDDVEITEEGLYVGSKVHNVCSYDVIYFPSVVAYLENNVGHNTNTSYYSDEIQEKYMHFEVIHEFRPNGSQTTYHKYWIDERSDLEFQYIYPQQVAPFGKPSYIYIPGARNDEMMYHEGSTAYYFTQDKWNNVNVPPNRFFTFNSDKTKGFEICFSKNVYWGKDENRRDTVKEKNGAVWTPATCKLYPIFAASKFPAGCSFDSISGRIPINTELNDGTTAIGWYWEHDDIIMTIDSHTECNTNIQLPSYMQNKRIEILDMTASVISYPPYRTGETIHYATNADIGHLVVRLYD